MANKDESQSGVKPVKDVNGKDDVKSTGNPDDTAKQQSSKVSGSGDSSVSNEKGSDSGVDTSADKWEAIDSLEIHSEHETSTLMRLSLIHISEPTRPY